MTQLTKLIKTRTEIESLAISYGNIIYCSDSNEIFYDYPDGHRGLLKSEICATEVMKDIIPENKRRYDRIYYTVLTNMYYFVDFDTRFYMIPTYCEDIFHITGETIDLRQGFMKNSFKYYAPFTMASSIIMDETANDDDPQSLQDFLDAGKLGKDGLGTKLHTATQTINVTDDETSILSVTYPISNYRNNGFKFLLFKNSMYMLESQYTINDNDTVTINDEEDYFDAGDVATFVFFYSVTTESRLGYFDEKFTKRLTTEVIDAGYVIVRDSTTNTYTKSSSTTASNLVIGVSSKSSSNTDTEVVVRMAGTIEVYVNGNTVAVGDLLVSYSDGKAAVSASPANGTMIGKVINVGTYDSTIDATKCVMLIMCR